MSFHFRNYVDCSSMYCFPRAPLLESVIDLNSFGPFKLNFGQCTEIRRDTTQYMVCKLFQCLI